VTQEKLESMVQAAQSCGASTCHRAGIERRLFGTLAAQVVGEPAPALGIGQNMPIVRQPVINPVLRCTAPIVVLDPTALAWRRIR
jgi:hypothetical protein